MNQSYCDQSQKMGITQFFCMIILMIVLASVNGIVKSSKNYWEYIPKSNFRSKRQDSQLYRKEDSCGKPFKTNRRLLNGLANGDDVQAGTFPWIAALFNLKNGQPNFICGGTLISKNVVITAAHCVSSASKPSDLLVVLGEVNVTNIKELTKVFKVRNIHAHPEYDVTSGDSDLAILELETEAVFDNSTRPACLWLGRNDLEDIVGRRGVLAGWGKNERDVLSLEQPRALAMPIVSQETCLRSHALFISITSSRTFCAGDRNGYGPCVGDSGNGLLIRRGGRWVLRGLVSRAKRMEHSTVECDLGFYIVFADISKFSDWISSKLNLIIV